MNLVLLGFLASLGAGTMTAVGAVPILFGRQMPRRFHDALLGFAAGVMLAAAFFSLIIPSLEISAELFGGSLWPATIAVSGVVVGVAVIALINEFLPHEHFVMGHEGPATEAVKKIWLFVIAIAIHNVPEGMAVGVGFGGGDIGNGVSLAIGIGLQNAPEGLAVAVALRSESYSRFYAFAVACLTGLIEPVAGLIGAATVSISEPLLPWALAFAAGAMLYVISHEIIPETHRRGHHNEATAGLTLGLAIMMFLDIVLG
ncbi:MAG: ZIP family metal transporter [Alphaproteobacteria bacterium]